MMLVWAIRLAPYAAIVGLALYALLLRGNAIDAQAEAEKAQAATATAVAANKAQADTIERLTAWRASEDKILVELGDEIGRLNQAADETSQAIEALRETNADVDLFLDTPLPDDLKRLLGR